MMFISPKALALFLWTTAAGFVTSNVTPPNACCEDSACLMGACTFRVGTPNMMPSDCPPDWCGFIIGATFECVNICAEGGDDPHFRTFQGQWFDYHGQCDLVMLEDKGFEDGLGLYLHVRTTKRYDFSFIESAALRIGGDVLQVNSWGAYTLNGVESAELPAKLANFATVTHEQKNKKSHEFHIQLSSSSLLESFTIKTFKDMVSIKFNAMKESRFHEGSMGGLLGNFAGEKVARDRKTIITDDVEFAEEWQVRDDEPMLFQTVRAPQFPAKCEALSAAEEVQRHRRLGENEKLRSEAEVACTRWKNPEAIERCVFDVLATNDLDMAEAGVY